MKKVEINTYATSKDNSVGGAIRGINRVDNLTQFVESDAELQSRPGGGYGHGLSVSALKDKNERNKSIAAGIAAKMTDEELSEAIRTLSAQAQGTELAQHLVELAKSRAVSGQGESTQKEEKKEGGGWFGWGKRDNEKNVEDETTNTAVRRSVFKR